MDDNYGVAKRILLQTTKRLQVSQDKMKSYDDAIRQYSKNGFAERVKLAELDSNCPVFFMPHHAILKESSATTKIRIVFNGSSSSRVSKSLNQNVETGPNLYPNLVAVLTEFRSHKIVLVADVTKAFLQIHVKEEDRNALCYLWYSECPKLNEPLPSIEIWRKICVPFGLKCSSFLLGACISKLLEMHKYEFGETVSKLIKSIYVDDIFIGADSEDEANTLYLETTEIFNRASLPLQKWASNSKIMNDKFSPKGVKNDIDVCRDQDIIKVLGLHWNPQSDEFSFRMDYVHDYASKAKADHLKLWYDWFEELKLINKIKLPRFYNDGLTPPIKQSLHIFCDASISAYGAVCYLVSKDSENNTNVKLLLSRSRVAPVKTQTIPRLELLGALTGATIASFIRNSTRLRVDEWFFWTDSSIVLYWLHGDPLRWNTYVRNRVIMIQELTNGAIWHHCSGECNPADLVSRGLSAEKLIESSLWWGGPSWIGTPESVWPITSLTKLQVNLEEIKKEQVKKAVVLPTVIEQITESEKAIDVTRFSKMNRLLRATAYVFKAVRIFRNKEESKNLDNHDLIAARRRWIRWTQEEAFGAELKLLMKGQPIPKRSVLKDYTLVIDKDGILRIQTRMGFHHDGMIEPNPIVLPNKNKFVNLLIQEQHERVMHSGIRDTLANIRSSYFILKGRQAVKWVLERCCSCRWFQAKAYTQPVAPVPRERVSQQQPFESSGLDYCGPFYVKVNKDLALVKGYVLVFTCAAIRAVHFEYTQDMTTREFLLAFRRFVARRGHCRNVYSDNARTFQRAASDLKELVNVLRDPTIKQHFADYGINWSFIAERAPWWGGFWERMVRSLKDCLRRTLHKAILTTSEFITILAEAEAVINSRPLTYMYSGSKETMPLTPAHFLIGTKLSSLPPTTSRDPAKASGKEIERLWRTRQNLMNRFWKMWFQDYLQELRNFHQTKAVPETEPKVGDLVIVKEDVSRLLWKTAVIVEVQPGRDGLIRSCILRGTNGSHFRRAVQHLYLLEAAKGHSEGEPSVGCVEEVISRSSSIIGLAQLSYQLG